MDDEHFMALALQQARRAAAAGEVPVGAVVVKDGRVIASGFNAPIGRHDPSAHAEMLTLRAAASAQGNYRLDGCELYVTLEPCAMCAGAILHARLKRVVFGAADPKTGAAGSVVNLFDNPRLNHQTQIGGGVRAAQCGGLLQDFFQQKRSLIRALHCPVREDALRTPDVRFDRFAPSPGSANYVSDLPALAGLRLHYLDVGPHHAPSPFFCLHGTTDWSYAFRHKIADWVAAGHRVVAPDLIGFGRSDKPKRQCHHTLSWHRQVLTELAERLDLRNAILVVPRRVEAIWRSLLKAAPEHFSDLLVLETQGLEMDAQALAAPFPDNGHRAALRAFEVLCPDIE